MNIDNNSTSENTRTCRLRFLLRCLAFFFLFSFSTHKAIAKAVNVKKYVPSYGRFYYPWTAHLGPTGGYTTSMPGDSSNTLLWGGKLDLSLLYINKTLWRFFDSYPQIGLSLSFNAFNLKPKGYNMGALFFIKPYYNHLSRFNIVPKVGIGVASVKAPRFSKDKEEELLLFGNERKVPEKYKYYKRLLDMYFQCGLVSEYKFTQKWTAYLAGNFNYLGFLTGQGGVRSNKKRSTSSSINGDQSISYASLDAGVAYTFNPSVLSYQRKKGSRKYRMIDIGLLGAFKDVPEEDILEFEKKSRVESGLGARTEEQSRELSNRMIRDMKKKQYYTIGIYGLYRLPVASNFSFTCATEWVFDSAQLKLLQMGDLIRESGLRVGVLLGTEMQMGQLAFGGLLGLYLFDAGILEKGKGIQWFNNRNYLKFYGKLNIVKGFYLLGALNLKNTIKKGKDKKGKSRGIFKRETLEVGLGYSS